MHVRDDGTFYFTPSNQEINDGTRAVRISTKGEKPGLEAYADLKILVPAKGDVLIYSGIGDISARNIEANLLLNTAIGHISAEKIQGKLAIDTIISPIKINDIRAESVNIKQSMGETSVENMQGALKIDKQMGNISVENVQGALEIGMHTDASGNVAVVKKIQGAVTINTNASKIEANDIRSDHINMKTNKGNISLSETRASQVDLKTGNGNVNVDLTSNMVQLAINSGSGNVTVRTTDKLGAKLDLETATGGIKVEFPVSAKMQDKNHLRGTVGNGRGKIKIKTESGNIQLLPRGDANK